MDITPGVYGFYEPNIGDYFVQILIRPGYTTYLGYTLGGDTFFSPVEVQISGDTVTLSGTVDEQMLNMDISFPITLTYDSNFTLVSPSVLWTAYAGQVSDYTMSEAEMAEYYYWLYE